MRGLLSPFAPNGARTHNQATFFGPRSGSTPQTRALRHLDRVKAASEFRHVATGAGVFPRDTQSNATIQGIKLEGAKADLLEQALKARDQTDLEHLDAALKRRDTLFSGPEKDFLKGVAEDRFDDISDDRFEDLAAEGLRILGQAPFRDTEDDIGNDVLTGKIGAAQPPAPTATGSEQSTKPSTTSREFEIKDTIERPEKPPEIYADKEKAVRVILKLMRGDLDLSPPTQDSPNGSERAKILTIDNFQLELHAATLYGEAAGMTPGKLTTFQRRVAQDGSLDDVQKATLLTRARESAAGRRLETLDRRERSNQVHQDLLRLDAYRTERRKMEQLLGGAAVMHGLSKGPKPGTSLKSGITGAASDAAGGIGQAGAADKTRKEEEK